MGVACPYRQLSAFTPFRRFSSTLLQAASLLLTEQAIRMLSDRLETFTSELLSAFFNPLPFVVTSLHNTIVSELPTFLGTRWRMRKQSIPGPSSVRPGIEAEAGYTINRIQQWQSQAFRMCGRNV